MKINFVSGYSGDRVEVQLSTGVKHIYSFGRNASYNRANSSDDKPYIGDILRDLVEYSPVGEPIEYGAYYLLSGKRYLGAEAEAKVFNDMLSEV